MSTLNIIKNPRITEKASVLAEQNVYVFDVLKSANKTEVKKAIIEIYKVHPVKINISSVPRKQVLTRGKVGSRGGGKKAIVFLKKGDKIELI